MGNLAHVIGNSGVFDGTWRALRVRLPRQRPPAEAIPDGLREAEAVLHRSLSGKLRELYRRWYLALTLASAVVILGLLTTMTPAWAGTTFTVNSTGDAQDANISDGQCQTATSSECTLRAAIQQANNTSTNAGLDTIHFNIPGSGVKTIAPNSRLPTITEPVTIDGYTQGDGTADDATPNTLAIGDNAHLLIELSGANAGSQSSGLDLAGTGGSTVRGLVINSFSGHGIVSERDNTIEGNYIGTDTLGTTGRGNSLSGVDLIVANDTTIGGTTDGERNVISGNESGGGGSGVFIQRSSGNQVQGNYIGTKANGTEALGNNFRGVVLQDADNNTIGGTASGAGNVISGNRLSGVFIRGSGSNQVQGNYIGTDKNGTAPLGNSSEGVNIDSGSGHTVGGTTDGERNVISSNQGDGVFISGSDSQVQGNYIGTDKNGTRPAGAPDLGNSGAGVDIGSQGANNTIGGTASGAGNVISDNATGVFVGGNSNQVVGNHVGTDASGTTNLGNSSDGVAVSGTNDSILSNSIFANGDLGIDLAPNGVTPNDPQDPDSGANNLQNFPVIDSAERDTAATTTTLKGKLNSTPNTSFTLQFFSSPEKDPSGYGEGKTYLGNDQTVTTDANGDASFAFATTTSISPGEFVTATATDPNGNTSEFSAAVEVAAADTAPVADPQSVTTDEDTQKTITLSATDADGDPLTYKITSLPAHGKLYDGTGTGGTEITSASTTLSSDKVTYLPNANYNGPDSFEFLANDGTKDSNTATVTITVKPLNVPSPPPPITAPPPVTTTPHPHHKHRRHGHHHGGKGKGRHHGGGSVSLG